MGDSVQFCGSRATPGGLDRRPRQLLAHRFFNYGLATGGRSVIEARSLIDHSGAAMKKLLEGE